MPLSALFKDERLESWSMTTDEWAQLKREYKSTGLTMACGQAGVPKTSSIGTQFFAHKPGTDCQLHEGGPESPEHLATKAAVARAAREIGWEAVIEYPAPDRSWIADVMVTNGERRIAIEAQWSPQSRADFERRQERYEAAGLECFWLVPTDNSVHAAPVPHYKLTGTKEDLHIGLPSLPLIRGFELGDGIKSILKQEMLPVAEFVAMSALVRTQMSRCWKCERWMSLWAVRALDLQSRCGGETTLVWITPWEPWALHRHEKALEEPIRRAIEKSDLPAPIKLQTRRNRYKNFDYLAMNCPSCGIVQGDGMLEWHWDANQYHVSFGSGIRLPFTDQIRARNHVCQDVGRGRCSQESHLGHNVPGIGYPPANEHVQPDGYGGDWERDTLPPKGSRWAAR